MRKNSRHQEPKEITWETVADWYGWHGFSEAEANMEEIQQTFRSPTLCMKAIEMAAYVDMPVTRKAVAQNVSPKTAEFLYIW